MLVHVLAALLVTAGHVCAQPELLPGFVREQVVRSLFVTSAARPAVQKNQSKDTCSSFVVMSESFFYFIIIWPVGRTELIFFPWLMQLAQSSSFTRSTAVAFLNGSRILLATNRGVVR